MSRSETAEKRLLRLGPNTQRRRPPPHTTPAAKRQKENAAQVPRAAQPIRRVPLQHTPRTKRHITSDIFTTRPSATDFTAASARASAISPSSPVGSALPVPFSAAMKVAISAA